MGPLLSLTTIIVSEPSMSKQLKLNQFFTGTSKRNQDESSTAKTSGSDHDQDSSLADECCEPEKRKHGN